MIQNLIVLAVLLLAPALAVAQKGVYKYEKSTTLSGAAETVTIHLLTGSTRTIKFQGGSSGVSVYCSVACGFSLERNGAAPTTTADLAVSEINGGGTGQAKAFHTSNVGTSTVIKNYNVAAGEEKAIDLTDCGLTAGQNITIRSTSISGNIRIYFQWREY